MIAIVDTGGANHASIQHALDRLGFASKVTLSRDMIARSSHVILPGVGHAGFAMNKINEADLVDTLRELKTPILGICLGMQLLFEQSDEGDAHCLGLLPGRVRKLTLRPDFQVPHMGWCRLQPLKPSQLLAGVRETDYVYFTHSFYIDATAETASEWLTSTVHGEAAIASSAESTVHGRKLYATQFHPERSGPVGAAILKNFLASESTNS
jgi:glutamine amidotransferase